MNFSCVYRITNVSNGKVYVGSAKCLRKRWTSHLWAWRAGKHSPLMQRAFNKYGEQSFVLDVLERVSVGSLLEREQWWIDRLSATDRAFGYNTAPRAGNTLGVVCSAETRRKIADANQGRRYTGETLARKQAAARHPDQIARLRAIVRSPQHRSDISRTKGGTGKLLMREEAMAAARLYETGDHTVKGLAAKLGVTYGVMFKSLKGEGSKDARCAAATSGNEPQQVARRIALTLRSMSPEIMDSIASRRALGEKQNDMAREFGVSTATISRIINKYTRGLHATQ